jgi:hypothetical protein
MRQVFRRLLTLSLRFKNPEVVVHERLLASLGLGPGLHSGECVTVNSTSIVPVAIAQAAPVYHNKTGSLAKALELIRSAAK